MEDKIPKTKEECFALLDDMLSEKDKQYIIENDTDDLHFTLGMWIRNNWLHSQSIKDGEELMKTFTKNFVIWDTDDCSSIILDNYRKYLKITLKK